MTPDVIPDLMKQSLGVSFDTSVGHDYIEDVEARLDYYQRKDARLPFDLAMLNKVTNGGVPKKTLNVLLAGTNVGKSLSMCHMATAHLNDGKNVLYITMEMSQEEIGARIDANQLSIPLSEVASTDRDVFLSRFQKIKKPVGKLVIKEFPTASAHVRPFPQSDFGIGVEERFSAGCCLH